MLLNRESLKSLFTKGKFPSENHFAHLIDSSVNKVEDGFGKSPEDGLQLSPQGKRTQLISVYETLDRPHPDWQINLEKEGGEKGLSFDQVTINEENEVTTESRLFLGENGNVGVHTSKPWAPFEVNGTAGFKTRVGTYRYGYVPGDGQWNKILCGLTGVQAFEVVARIDGIKNRGKYAITHAIALSAFGGKLSRKRIKQTRAYYGWYWNRIELRWTGDIYDYNLEVRTNQPYGNDEYGNLIPIKYHITKLWDDQLFNEEALRLSDCMKQDMEREKTTE